MKTIRNTRTAHGFSFVEAIFAIAIIGIMSALVVAAISNVSRDAHTVMARQQQAEIQSSLTAWVMSQTRVSGSNQVRSLESVRSEYNAQPTTKARYMAFLMPDQLSLPEKRAGFLDQTTSDHILEYTGGNSDRLKTSALENIGFHLELPSWASDQFPRVDLVKD